MKRLFPVLALALAFSGSIYGQAWSGIIATSRAVDWSATSPGVVGGIPSGSWTQCGATIAAYGTASSPASSSTIQTAINACTASHYVLLGSGTFYLNAGINMKAGVVLRGAGANLTTIAFTAGTGCGGLGAQICFKDANGFFYGSTSVAPGNTNSASWTGTNATNGTYTQGATSIRLTSIGSSAVHNGDYILLDQNNDNPATPSTGFTSGLLICDNTSATDGCSLESGSPGRCSSGAGTNPCSGGAVHRNLIQPVKVTAGCSSPCTGAGPFDVTITPGIYGKKWATGFSPGAWWSGSDMQNSGLENLTIDNTAVGTSSYSGIYFNNAFNCWVSGVRSVKPNRNHVWLWQSAHISVINSYFYGTQSNFSQAYGVESFIAGDNLVMNNIFQQVTAPIILGPSMGSVFAHNFSINDTFGTPAWMQQAFAWRHDAGAVYNLSEGNISSGYWADVFHGTGGLNTVYRNYAVGWEVGKTEETVPYQLFSYNRFENVINNVLGCNNATASYPGNCGSPYHTNYTTTNGVGQAKSIYDLNAGNHNTTALVLPDAYVTTSLMRWGNYDVVNAASRWVSGEVPSGLADGYANPVPTTGCTASIACPASFFTTQPAYWSRPWPGIGSDVTGGNVPGVAGHVYTNPAADCYLTTMGGPADGTGSILSFNPITCYSGTQITPPAAPTNLAVSVSNSNATLTWTASTGSPSGYTVFRGTVSGGPYTQIATSIAGTSYVDVNLAGGTYYWVVKAFNSAGSSANSSQVSAVISPAVSIPSVPTNLVASAAATTISLTWTQSTGTPTSNKVFRATVSGGPYTLLTNLTATTNYTDAGLANGTYYYVVQGCNSAGCSANSNQASGTVNLAPVLTATPSFVNFGNVTLGSTSGFPTGTTITNMGTSNLILASSSCVTVSGPNAADFTIVSAPSCPSTIVPNATATITLSFTPSIVGTETASLVILSNDPSSPDTVSLTGTGTGAVAVSPTTLSFGNVYTNKSSAAQVVTFTNNSGVTATFSSIALTTGTQFAITNNTCGGSVASGAFCTISITFTPTSNGNKTDILTFTFTGAAGSPQTVTMSGKGTKRTILKVGAVVRYSPPRHGRRLETA